MSEVPAAALEGAGPSPLQIPEFRRLLAISVTVALGFGLLVPVLPDFARSFGVSLAAVGLVQLVFGLTRFSSGIGAGLAVDRFGERAVTITGILIVAASSYAAGLSESFPQLVVARGAGGVGSSLFISGLMNRILRIIEPGSMGRATGVFRSSFLVGIAIGPAVGGVTKDALGIRAPFFIYAWGLVVAALIAFFAMRGGPERAPAEKRSPLEALRTAGPLFADLRYVVALAATFVAWWTLSGPAQVIGVVFGEDVLGFTGTQVGLALTLLSGGELLAMFVAGRVADTVGRRAVLVPSLAVTAVTVALLGQIEAVPWAFFPLLAILGAAVASGSVASGGLLADAIPRAGSGAGVGVNQMAGDLGYLIAPTAIGYIAEHPSFNVAYLVAALPAAIVFFLALRLPSKTSEPAPEPVSA